MPGGTALRMLPRAGRRRGRRPASRLAPFLVASDVCVMDEERSHPEIVEAAVDALLMAVKSSAEDLRAFHDVVAKARGDNAVPFPRVAVATAESVIDHLKTVEQKLQEVLVALGLARPSR